MGKRGSPRKLGRFRNDAARQTYLTAYDAALTCWPVAPDELNVETRWGTTHVLATGSPNGTPIVLLHAVAVASPAWFSCVAALGERHRVYAVDTISDVGRSTQTTPIGGPADLAQWFDDVLGALSLERVHLVGLSYGGWLALSQAHRSSGRLASVVSVDPVGALGRGRWAELIKMIPEGVLALATKSDEPVYRLMRRLNSGALPEQPLLDLSVTGLRTFVAKQPFPKRMTDEQLRSIRTPTLLLFGDRSPVNHAHRAADRARALIPKSAVDVVPGAGHMLPVQMPELFAIRTLRFIGELD